MGRKHFETFGCEQERLWLELEKNMESQEEVFMVVVMVVVMLFKHLDLFYLLIKIIQNHKLLF